MVVKKKKITHISLHIQVIKEKVLLCGVSEVGKFNKYIERGSREGVDIKL